MPEATAKKTEPNYDEKLVPVYTLPSPLTRDDGTTVKTVAEWENSQRTQIMAVVEKHLFGKIPPAPDEVKYQVTSEKEVFGGLGTRKTVRFTFNGKFARDINFDVLVYIPKAMDRFPVQSVSTSVETTRLKTILNSLCRITSGPTAISANTAGATAAGSLNTCLSADSPLSPAVTTSSCRMSPTAQDAVFTAFQFRRKLSTRHSPASTPPSAAGRGDCTELWTISKLFLKSTTPV